MKSAIFLEPGLKEPRARKPAAKKWSRTHSPFIASPVTSKWNLDEMIASYTSSGALPPLLSPSLPSEYTSAPAPTHTPAYTDHDIESLPMSLLSPTLPALYSESPRPATLAQPIPKKPIGAGVLGTARASRVRWIDKSADRDKPRFLLRILFKDSAKYKTAFRTRSPTRAQGLAIFDGSRDVFRLLQSPSPAPWPKVVRDLREQREKHAKNPMYAIVVQFDIVLTLAVCLYAEQASDWSRWETLMTEIPLAVHRIEKYIKAGNVSDKKKSYFSFLVGVLATTKALVLKKHNSLLRAKGEPESTLALQTMLANYSKIENDLAEAQSFFANCPPAATVFPKSWHTRSLSFPRQTEASLSPWSDKFFLPLGVYSDLREACAYLFCCVREFCEVFATELGAKYTLQAGQKK